MKTSFSSKFALVAAISLALTVGAEAQQRIDIQPKPGETSLEFASRVDACNGAAVQSAEFIDNATRLRVKCATESGATKTNGMTGGLGGGAIAIGATVGLIIFALGSGGSSSTTSTTSTN